jgi:hypothetical protein
MHKPKLLLFFVFLSIQTIAQSPSTPVEYMEFLAGREERLSEKYLSYMSEVAHGNKARRMEKRRQELINAIRQSLSDATKLRPFKGDASLRDVYKNYWDVLLKVFTEDYHKIVDMEEIAEQSYDNMEAYLLAQEKAGEVLNAEGQKIGPVYSQFAASNNVRLIEDGDTKMEKKLRKVGAVNEYYHKIFLIFFKSFKQEAYVWDAVTRKDLNAFEQNNNTLRSFATEGLSKLDTLKPYGNDGSVVTACRKVVEFYKRESENQLPAVSDYVLKTGDFERIKKTYDAKPQAKRTQSDVDAFNNAVNDINKAIDNYNKVLKDTNDGRAKVLQNWDLTVKKFMDSHVPKAR